MQPITTILTCLDLSPKDRRILAHIAAISAAYPHARLRFLHVLPKGQSRSSQEADALLKTTVGSVISENESPRSEYIIEHGDPLQCILQHTRDGLADLLICGKAKLKHDHQLSPARIARKAACSVLLVSQQSECSLDRILVALDKSEDSRAALQTAACLSPKEEYAKLILLRVIETPFGDQINLGSNHSVDLRERERAHIETFVAKSNIGEINFETAVVANEKASQAILEVAKKRDATLIVLGSKGKGALAATLLGSTVENVAKNTRLPLLVIKRSKKDA